MTKYYCNALNLMPSATATIVSMSPTSSPVTMPTYPTGVLAASVADVQSPSLWQ